MHFIFFLMVGEKKVFSIPWVKWEKVATPKALGGWGLQNIYKFSTTLATKCGWQLISTTSLWMKVVVKKYISPFSLIDWIRQPQNTYKGGSIFWKAIIKLFHLIEDHLAWNVGDGTSVRIGLDPWLESGIQYILAPNIIEHLEDKGILYLN